MRTVLISREAAADTEATARRKDRSRRHRCNPHRQHRPSQRRLQSSCEGTRFSSFQARNWPPTTAVPLLGPPHCDINEQRGKRRRRRRAPPTVKHYHRKEHSSVQTSALRVAPPPQKGRCTLFDRKCLVAPPFLAQPSLPNARRCSCNTTDMTLQPLCTRIQFNLARNKCERRVARPRKQGRSLLTFT
jgi:hypothetical protein